MDLPIACAAQRRTTARASTNRASIPQPGGYPRELRFEVGDRLPDVPRRFPELALVLARALA